MNNNTTTDTPVTITGFYPTTASVHRRDMKRVNTVKGPHTITITNQQYHNVGYHLVSFLADHIGIGNYKLRFARNAANQILEGNPVDIEFVNADYELLFRLLIGGILENVKPSY